MGSTRPAAPASGGAADGARLVGIATLTPPGPRDRRSTATHVPTPSGGVGPATGRTECVRTCVGCRQRDARSVLLRVVVEEVGGVLSAAPDPRARHPGRGAWLHPRRTCLDLAERRRAFGRALRRPADLDLSGLRLYVERVPNTTVTDGSGSSS
ncbi:YlxR family protein [Kineococcus glutinatus]|uniref:YlxR family protein n=1 Tax=Kineococcus glutinatus TaxID=1070872 RepID=UPI0031EF4641